MSRYCLVDRNCTPEQARDHKSHTHISRIERDELLRRGAAEFLVLPSRGVSGIVRLTGAFRLRGFSTKYGEYLASRRNGWIVKLILADMHHRRIEE